MKISLSSDNYSIVSSGETFLFGADKDLRMNIVADDHFEFSVVFRFEDSADGEHHIDKKVNDNIITLTCYNFEDLGTGLTKPMNLARIEGRDILLTFWAYAEGPDEEKVRSVKYTIFMSNHSGDEIDGK